MTTWQYSEPESTLHICPAGVGGAGDRNGGGGHGDGGGDVGKGGGEGNGGGKLLIGGDATARGPDVPHMVKPPPMMLQSARQVIRAS